MPYCKENFGDSESFWNTEMIETDRFGKEKNCNFIFFVFFHILTEKISYHYETVWRLNFVILSLLH